MDTSGCFTCCEKTRNYVALSVDNLSLRIDLDAAHRVVDTRGDLDRIERCLAEIVCHALPAEFLIFIGGNSGIPGFHGLCKVLYRVFTEAHVLRKCFIGLSADGIAAINKLLSQSQSVYQILVKDNEAVAVRLLEFSL